MIPKNLTQLKAILTNLQVEGLARETGFTMRQVRKIDTVSFLAGFFQMMVNGSYSLRLWACNIASLNGSLISFQSIAKKLDFRQEPFFHALFQKALLAKIQQRLNFKVKDLLMPFGRVLIEDSTCFRLPKGLFEFFPGPRLPHGRIAGGRLQLRIDLKHNSWEAIAIQSYCQSDKCFADDILNTMHKNDLLIRDLGYWGIPVFSKIIALGGFFLSRLNLAVHVLNTETQQIIDLVRFLEKKEQQGINHVDMTILLSDQYRIPVRLVAIKLTHEQTQKRRRMSKAQRHKDCRITDRAFYLMSWNLFITNVPDEIWDVHSVYHAYTLRWHIEMIFKCWKSKFNFCTFFKNCHGRNPAKPEIILLLILTWFVLIYLPSFNKYANQIWQSYRRILSPLRFADYLILNFPLLMKGGNSTTLPLLAYHCCYDRRKDRLNHFEKTYMNSLS